MSGRGGRGKGRAGGKTRGSKAKTGRGKGYRGRGAATAQTELDIVSPATSPPSSSDNTEISATSSSNASGNEQGPTDPPVEGYTDGNDADNNEGIEVVLQKPEVQRKAATRGRGRGRGTRGRGGRGRSASRNLQITSEPPEAEPEQDDSGATDTIQPTIWAFGEEGTGGTEAENANPESEVDGEQTVIGRLAIEIADELLEEVLLEIVFEQHRKLRLGTLCLNCDSPQTDIVQKRGYDIFGQNITGRSGSSSQANVTTDVKFDCPNCGWPVVASRYAPHLEKCMGIGRTTRNSSRLASHRLSAYRPKSKRLTIDDSLVSSSGQAEEEYEEKEGEKETELTTIQPLQTRRSSCFHQLVQCFLQCLVFALTTTLP
jgi:hypothetical protein